MIGLDTNAAIAVINGSSPSVRDRLVASLHRRQTVAIRGIVLFELRYGAAKSQNRRRNIQRIAEFLAGPISVLPFEPEDAKEAGDIRAELERTGTPIGPYDLLIAGQARRRSATLVTANAREFVRVPGLKMENWVTG